MDLNSLIPADLTKYVDIIIAWVITYTPKIVGALITLWIWFKIASFIGRSLEKILKKEKIDKTIGHFLASLIKNILKTLVIVAAIGIIWVETSSFVAMFAALWIALGMALSGTLWHFASGIMILLFRPYKVWDLIETAGHFGTVKEVQIFNTILKTLDAKTIIIPNSTAIDWSITNYSMEWEKRVDLEIWISYTDSIDQAKEVLEKIAKKESRVIDSKWYTIAVKELWDNAVILVFRVWVKTEDYWDVYFHLTETVKKRFDKEWLNFPFPQRDVHMYNQK